MAPEPSPTLEAARDLAARGWPVMPVRHDGKDPLTRHGVKDATTDERTILHWFDKWPDANLGIATGAPGPTVLDIDNLDRGAQVLADLEQLGAPEAATARGRHLYFRGTEQGTVTLGYGELRGRGSYVVCPPSTHPSGKAYVWLVSPNGPLPDLPAHITGDKAPAGVGIREEPRELVSHGARHDHLKDFATRLLRSGVTDEPTIAAMLEAEFNLHCVTTPPPKPREFTDLARWATRTRIADRERKRKTEPEKTKNGNPTPPDRDAPLNEHRAYAVYAAGIDPVDIVHVDRDGARLIDGMRIVLATGVVVEFARQGDIPVRGSWRKTWYAATAGMANPPNMKEWELEHVFRSLCILAEAPVAQLERDDMSAMFDEFIDLTEALLGHTIEGTTERYLLVQALRDRGAWNPKDPRTEPPVLIIDRVTEAEYLRAGDLWAYAGHLNAGISGAAFPGRMRSIGMTRISVSGREPSTPERTGAARRKSQMWLYRIEAS